MDDQVFQLINEKIDSIEQNMNEKFVDVSEKVEAVAADVSKLLQFKWQIIGGSVVASVFITLIFQLWNSLKG